jgi:hypothetical protein
MAIEVVRAVAVDQSVGCDRGEEAGPCRRREPSIDGKRSIASVPDPPQCVDERRPAGEVDGNEVGHGQKATVTP